MFRWSCREERNAAFVQNIWHRYRKNIHKYKYYLPFFAVLHVQLSVIFNSDEIVRKRNFRRHLRCIFVVFGVIHSAVTGF